jgi:aminoglycoside/choline kinase family phosphotransferase
MDQIDGISAAGRAFLAGSGWREAVIEPLAGDASVRRYFRLRQNGRTALLMEASRYKAFVPPFLLLARHLCQLGFSAPVILADDFQGGFLVVEDFGDEIFSRLLEAGHDEETLYALATDVLIALHEKPMAVPPGLRIYHPQQMLADIELYLDYRVKTLTEAGRVAFRKLWSEVLPLAHRVPQSLLLRDYHVANLMLLREREGIQAAGLIDFQDAYGGPVTYDLVSLLEDARRDLAPGLREKMLARYRAQFPALDRDAFDASLAVVAALRHTRVLAIFERLSAFEGKHDYKRLHMPRVERLHRQALDHPLMAKIKQWFDEHPV